jgi:hypothetical protein
MLRSEFNVAENYTIKIKSDRLLKNRGWLNWFVRGLGTGELIPPLKLAGSPDYLPLKEERVS